MKCASLVIASITLATTAPAVAQGQAVPEERGAAAQADVQVRNEVVETIFPAQRVIPPRPAPVIIERVEIEEVPTQAGADFVRSGTQTGPVAAYRMQRTYLEQADGSRLEVVGLPAGARIVSFDREAWLSECRNRLATHDESERGKVIGALAGAALGGVAGNRIAGSGNRLVGTVAGAAVGALAGGAIGDSIDDKQAAPASAYGECEAYLDDYMQTAANGGFSNRPSYAGEEYMLVPVTVSEPQKAVYREVAPSE